MNHRTKNRIKGFFIIVFTVALVVILVRELWPQPTSDIEFMRVDMDKVILEGETIAIAIDLKNNTGEVFDRELNIRWIPDPSRGSSIAIYQNRIHLLAFQTKTINHEVDIRGNFIAPNNFKKPIKSQFVLSGDQLNENNIYTTDLSFYKKSQTDPIRDRFRDLMIQPSSSYTIQYRIDGESVTKNFKSKEELMRASIPKEAQIEKLNNARNKNLMTNMEAINTPAVSPNH